jgi:hypothetical protein
MRDYLGKGRLDPLNNEENVMSIPTQSGWTPRALDVESQQADLGIFKTLHKVTAVAVLPVLLGKFQSFAAQGLASDFAEQAALIAKALTEESSLAGVVDPELDGAALKSSLTQFLSGSSTERSLTASDGELAKQLAAEFAGSFWATIISSLVRQNHKDGLVSPRDLLPNDLHGGQTSALGAAYDDLSHFDLTSEDVNQVMAKSLMSLVFDDEYKNKFVSLPRNLRVNRAELGKYLNETISRYHKEKADLELEAVRLDRIQRHRSPSH